MGGMAGEAGAPLLAVHAATSDFCGIGTTVSLNHDGRDADIMRCVSDGKRFRILQVLDGGSGSERVSGVGIVLAECERVRDDPADASVATECESNLVQAIHSLASLRGGGVPNCVYSYMPDEAAMGKHYLASHGEVQTWLRMRSMRTTGVQRGGDSSGGSGGNSRIRTASGGSVRISNPYKSLSENVDVSWRRECFTFAVAEVCQLSDIEKMALMGLFDTVGRQQFLIAKLSDMIKRIAAEKALQ